MEAAATSMKKKTIKKKATKKKAVKKPTKKVNTYTAGLNEKAVNWVERTISSFEKTFPGKMITGKKAIDLVKWAEA